MSAAESMSHPLNLHFTIAQSRPAIQAVALVFENVLSDNADKNGALAAISPATADAAAGVSQPLSAPESPSSDASPSPNIVSNHAATAPGSLNAALKLLEDLCVMATGDLNPGSPSYLTRFTQMLA